MKNINDITRITRWSALQKEADTWHQIQMSQNGYDVVRSEVLEWLSQASFAGYYAFGMHPLWDDYLIIAIQNDDAAFAFKMRFGGL